MADQTRHRHGFLTPNAPLTDNVALLEWAEQSRKLLHMGSLELGITAAELDAKLRKVNPHLLVAGLDARYRARQISKPVAQAAEALTVASRYIITATNRFEAVFMPELEQAGYKPRADEFTFKA
ncbi:hypothetical protein [Catenuloplanes atrovinosus]|uniref:Uncharacterized protein n=1 Tax=Catenuloplanes atrovinosus TaxID=137266 RepID=A0AAE3YUN3_9ACTN|nr:hypothetical protein [Catenuloplanes atrovinosus]MDR7278957.1 hypothetical protein [Catenuloplanes atrovinosus]